MNVSDEGLRPDKNLHVFLPTISRAGTSDWMVSIATGSSSHCTLTAGLGDLKHFQRMVLSGIRVYWVVTLKVFLMMSVGNRRNEDEGHHYHVVPLIPCVVHGDLDKYPRQGLYSCCRHNDEH
jgi:hypothetical protein